MSTSEITFHPLEPNDKELIEAARQAILPLVDERFEGERLTSVGAAARWKDGRIFSAANVRHPSSGPACVCGEQSALVKAYSETHNRDLDVIIAYWHEKDDEENVINPCGRCRDFMTLFGDPWVIVRRGSIWKDRDWARVRLSDLRPLDNTWDE